MSSVTIADREYIIHDNYVTCAGVHVLNYDSRAQVMVGTSATDPASNVAGGAGANCNYVIFAGAETVTRLDAGGVSEFAGGVVDATTYFMQMGAVYVVYTVDSTLPIAVKQERPADQRYKTAQQIAHAWSAAFDTENTSASTTATTTANTARADYTEELMPAAARRVPRAMVIAAGIWVVINIIALVAGVCAVTRGDATRSSTTAHGSFLLAGADAASDITDVSDIPDDYLKSPLSRAHMKSRLDTRADVSMLTSAITNFLAFAHVFSLVFIFCVLTSECVVRVV